MAVLTAPYRIEVRDVPLPELHADDGLLEVEVNGLCGSDLEFFEGGLPDYPMPMALGHEPVGRVWAIGTDAARAWGIQAGDRVVVNSGIRCSAVKLAVNYMTIGTFALQMEAMEFARSYGLTEDALSSVLVTSSADSCSVRTWGFHDRLRRTAAAGTAAPQLVMKKDITSFAVAGAQNGLLLPLATVAAETLLQKVDARDRFLDEAGYEPAPRCATCSLELIAPYREAGVHPECARP